MKSITQKFIFWLTFSLLSIVCIGFSYQYFSTAFPIINLTLEMNRINALKKAALVAEQVHIGPTEFEQAASFGVDEEVQTFVELEAGGKAAFSDMLQESYYAPYQWTVRHFKECEKHEAIFKFKPDGTLYGFIETLSENATGASLEMAAARDIAEQTITQSPWNIHLTPYTLIETSKELQPSGRTDHTFTYERNDVVIGKGLYRLRLVVSGDRVTEITHFIKIPQEFTLRYQEMRSANNSIAAGASMAYLLLYILGGCIMGLFFLLRRNWILWKSAIIWAFIIAGLHVLVSINQLPLTWMHYPTALSMQGFLLKNIMGMLAQCISLTIFYGLIFIAAESLTRAAFSYQPQLWKLWNPQAASSWTIMSRTIGGYLLVPLCLAFIIFFYICTSRYLHWWMPSTSLIDPNILATYFPWLSCLVLSLGAGFMEECLFRAIPISCSALVGRRLGNQRLWLIIGFIVQALIFGAAHANYPAQPAYARVIELLFFSTLNGLVFLWFGLLPAIITHFTYDVVLMSLPLFVSTAAGAWIHQGIVIILTLIPLLIVIHARIRSGAWIPFNPILLNGSWAPTIHENIQEITPHIQEKKSFTPLMNKIIIAAGLGALILLIVILPVEHDTLRLDISKKQALESAYTALKTKNTSATSWSPLPNIAYEDKNSQDQQLQSQFIWQQGSPALYHQLLGTYLNPPRWHIRFVTWEGSVSDRAQEYIFSFVSKEKLYRYYHKIPENSPGEFLDESQARILAHEELKKTFDLIAHNLQEVSAIATKHPARKDWTFTFANSNAYSLKKGQLRNVVQIAGNEIVGSYSYVHVPEEWEREQLNTKNMLKIISFLCMLSLYLIIITGMIFALMHARKISLFSPLTLFFCASFCGLSIIKIINSWPLIIGTFTTSEPFMHQLFSCIGSMLISTVFRAGALGIILAIVTTWKKPYQLMSRYPWIYGISIGIFVAGIGALLQVLSRTYNPLLPDYSSLATSIPMLDSILQALIGFMASSAFLMVLCIIIDVLYPYWKKHQWLLILFCAFLGISIAGRLQPESTTLWLLLGILLGMLLIFIYATIGRYSNQALMWAMATIMGFYFLQQALFNAYPNAIIENIIALCVVFSAAYIWSKKIIN